MKQTRVEELRQQVKLFDGVTPAAQVASELLAEVDRLRKLLPPSPSVPDPASTEAVAQALKIAPRTLQCWIYKGHVKTIPDGRVNVEDLFRFLRDQGWESELLTALAEKLKGQ
jgi:hypothetical protein